MRRGDWQVQADLFNSLNSNVVIQQNQTFGTTGVRQYGNSRTPPEESSTGTCRMRSPAR